MNSLKIQKRDFAQTLARGMACLEVLAGQALPATNPEIAAKMRVSRAAGRRILLTLESLGYVREERGHYAVTPKVLSLGRSVLTSGGIWNSVAPEVVAVADRFNEPCSVSILDGLDIVYVCRDATRRIYSSRLGIGDRLPAHCSASGKMLLSALSEQDLESRLKGVRLKRCGPASLCDSATLKRALARVKANDFATAVDEMEDGLISIAVPLRKRDKSVAGAMALASHRSRMSHTELKRRVLPALREAAARAESIIHDFQDRNWIL